MPLWLTITSVIFALLFLSLQLYLFSRGSILSDGYSYFDAWESIKGGHTDPLRTPVYAIFAGLLQEVFGKVATLVIIPVIHWVLYLIALRGVWQTGWMLGIGRKVNCGVVLSMLIIPGFWCFNHLTMAETFSQCGVVLLVWLSGRYLLTPEKKWLYLAGLTMAMLLFTKPMFLFLIPLMALFWLTVCRKRKPHLLAGGTSIAATLTLAGVYLFCMNHTHTVTSFTIASTYNSYYCLRAEGLIHPDEVRDAELRERFRPMYDSIPGGWLKTQPYWQEMWCFNWPELDALVKTARDNHPSEVAASTIRRFGTSLSGSQFYSLVDELGLSPEYDLRYAEWNGLTKNQEGGFIYPLHRWLNFPIWAGQTILLLFILLWSFRWHRSGRFPALAALVSAIYLTAYITAVVGAQDSWGRIMTPVSPLLPLMAGSIASSIIPRLFTIIPDSRNDPDQYPGSSCKA